MGWFGSSIVGGIASAELQQQLAQQSVVQQRIIKEKIEQDIETACIKYNIKRTPTLDKMVAKYGLSYGAWPSPTIDSIVKDLKTDWDNYKKEIFDLEMKEIINSD